MSACVEFFRNIFKAGKNFSICIKLLLFYTQGVTPKKSLSSQQQKIKEQMRVQGTPPPVKRNGSLTV